MHVVVRYKYKKRLLTYAGFLVAALAIMGVSMVAMRVAQAVMVPITTEYKLPSGGQTHDLVPGPDGNLWLVGGTGVGRIVPSTGAVTEYSLIDDWGLTNNSVAVSLTVGPDNNIWVTHFDPFLGTSSLLQVSTSGVLLNQFMIANGAAQPYDVVAGPDGNMWFTEFGINRIGKMTMAGVVTEYTIPTANTGPHHITAGPDGNLWFTGWYNGTGNSINKITTSGVVTRYASLSTNSRPFDIAPGPDGNVWYTMVGTTKVGRITPTGTITEIEVNVGGTRGIVEGHDGEMWFTSDTDQFGHINTSTLAVTSYDDDDIEDDEFSQGYSIAPASDGNMWFTDASAYSIFRFSSTERLPANTGYTLSDMTTGGPQAGVAWRSVDSDNSGQKIIATDNTNVYVSNDGGVTWTNVSDGTDLDSSYVQDVAISADGSTLVAGGTPDGVFVSHDGGVTWTNTMLGEGIPQGNWYSVDVNEDGTKIVAALIGTDLYVTQDGGGTWTNATVTNPGTGMPWNNVIISDDGSTIAAGNFNGDLYISHDFGVTWTNAVATPGSTLPLWSSWNGFAITPDGQTIFVGRNGSDIYKSTDAGVTWENVTDTTPASGNSWSGIGISNDGLHIVAVEQNGGVFVSHDGGVTWQSATQYTGMSGNNWYDITISSDGSSGVIADASGAMYRAYDPSLVFVPPASGGSGGASGAGAGTGGGASGSNGVGVPNTGVKPANLPATVINVTAVVGALAIMGAIVLAVVAHRAAKR